MPNLDEVLELWAVIANFEELCHLLGILDNCGNSAGILGLIQGLVRTADNVFRLAAL